MGVLCLRVCKEFDGFMDNSVQRSGLDCFKELIKRLRLAPDYDGIVNEEMLALYDKDAVKALVEIAGRMDYQPEVKDISELTAFNGPAIALLKNNHFVCIVNCTQLATEKSGLFNPRGQNGPQNIVLPNEQLKQIAEGRCVIFNNLRDFDARRHSSVFALVSVANHHRIQLTPRRVMHDYAVSQDELTPRQLIRIAADNQMKAARTSLKWKHFAGMGKAFPIIGNRKDGKYIIICGYRETENGGELAVIDPNASNFQCITAARRQSGSV